MKPPSTPDRGELSVAATPGTSRGDLRLLDEAIGHAKGGDASATHFLYLRFAREGVAQAMVILGERRAAETVTQSVFADLELSEWGSSAEPFDRWILRRVRRAAVGAARPRRFSLVTQRLAKQSDLRREDLDDWDSLEEALQALPIDQREVLMLRHAGLPARRIAELLGRSEASVYGLERRGWRTLDERRGDWRRASASAGG